MPVYILTGSPGAGKTAILRQLELNGHAVVEEAATDVIALRQALGHSEPWRDPTFVEQVVALQRKRRLAINDVGITFVDRSPVCTTALCHYSALPVPPHLLEEIERPAAGNSYERTVFFVRNQGFVRATAARRISFEESLVFERIHELTYRDAGFDLVEVPAAPLPGRVAVVEQTIERLRRTS